MERDSGLWDPYLVLHIWNGTPELIGSILGSGPKSLILLFRGANSLLRDVYCNPLPALENRVTLASLAY